MPSYNRVVTRYSNGTTEVIDYEIPQEYGYTRIKKDNIHLKSNGRVKLGRKKDKKSDFKEINVFKNSVRAQKKIRQLCNNNPLLLHKFITLTFAAVFKEHDIKQANYLYKKFCQRLEYFVKKKIQTLNSNIFVFLNLLKRVISIIICYVIFPLLI